MNARPITNEAPSSCNFAGKIRAARASDYPRMAELAGQLSYPIHSGRNRASLGRVSCGSADARSVSSPELETGEIAGWIAVFVYRTVEADARAEISGLVVDERFRSQRIGEHLLAARGRMGARARLPARSACAQT